MDIPKKKATLNEVAEFYLNSEVFRNLSHTSQRDYEAQLKAVLSTRVEGKELGSYKVSTIGVRYLTQAYEQWAANTGVRSANYRRAVLSTAWKHAMRYDVMDHNPVSLVKTQASKPRRVKWTRDQVRTFLDTAYSKFEWRNLGLIVHMSYDWGQRVGDMRVLTWDKLDLDQCRLDLTQSKRNAEVHLPISTNLCAMLRQQKEDFGFQRYVAPHVKPKNGSYYPYTKPNMSMYINEILAEANLPTELTAMDLRRTAVTEMMEAGVDLASIMQVTGHSHPDSVKPYMVNTFSGASRALALRGNKDEEE